MKSNLDAVDAVFEHLQGSDLEAAISGNLMKNRRLTNSILEDVVVNSLPIDNSQMQRGVINVNIHVPNLEYTMEGGGVDRSFPNHNRLKELTDLAKPLLKDYWHPTDWNMDIENINLLQEEESSFMNIRISFYAINI